MLVVDDELAACRSPKESPIRASRGMMRKQDIERQPGALLVVLAVIVAEYEHAAVAHAASEAVINDPADSSNGFRWGIHCPLRVVIARRLAIRRVRIAEAPR